MERVHKPEACGVSMNAPLYESADVLELQIDREKEMNSPQCNTAAVREVPDSSRTNRNACRCAGSASYVAQAITLILEA